MNKRDRAYLKKLETRVRKSAARKSAHGKKVLSQYREYLENAGYDADEIENQTADGAHRWQDERVHKARRSERVRFTKNRVYLYAQKVDGRKLSGRWYSHRAYASRVRAQSYWRDIRRMTSIYEYTVKEARETWRRVHNPKIGLEIRNQIKSMLRDVFGDTPIKDSQLRPGRKEKPTPKKKPAGDRSRALKQYWKAVRRIKNKRNISLDYARRVYAGTKKR
jgi:hypothetical protein